MATGTSSIGASASTGDRGKDRDLVPLAQLRLQSLAGYVDHGPLAGIDLTPRRELLERRDRDPARGLGEDPGRLGEEPDPGPDLVVVHRLDGPPRAARKVEGVDAVGGVSDRKAL